MDRMGMDKKGREFVRLMETFARKRSGRYVTRNKSQRVGGNQAFRKLSPPGMFKRGGGA